MNPAEPTITVDARGHRCPTPTLRLRRALEPLEAGAVVELLADDPLARVDVPHFVAQAGCTLVSVEDRADGGTAFRVEKRAAPNSA